ncbi:MAG: hypothetical protein NC417_10820 [Candidatus Gastranaerophilales bacterium]|nr:hypothetical protein [Candidatus Gastranaerophilales bacterium]
MNIYDDVLGTSCATAPVLEDGYYDGCGSKEVLHNFIAIGDNVRIDDFCILSGNITIESYIHIAAGTYLFGGKSGIVMNDFSAISSRSAVYADSDDYSGTAITNPTVSDEFRNIVGGLVTFGRHVIIGSGCTILPNVTLKDGVAVGAMSLVNHSLEGWNMYAGIPCRKIRERKKICLFLKERF